MDTPLSQHPVVAALVQMQMGATVPPGKAAVSVRDGSSRSGGALNVLAEFVGGVCGFFA